MKGFGHGSFTNTNGSNFKLFGCAAKTKRSYGLMSRSEFVPFMCYIKLKQWNFCLRFWWEWFFWYFSVRILEILSCLVFFEHIVEAFWTVHQCVTNRKRTWLDMRHALMIVQKTGRSAQKKESDRQIVKCQTDMKPFCSGGIFGTKRDAQSCCLETLPLAFGLGDLLIMQELTERTNALCVGVGIVLPWNTKVRYLFVGLAVLQAWN